MGTIGYYASDDIRTLDMTPAIPANQLSAVPNASMAFGSANQLATFNPNPAFEKSRFVREGRRTVVV